MKITIEELYQSKLEGNDRFQDIQAHMETLRAYASRCVPSVVVEFGTRTGNSTTAFLMGGARVHSYDIAACGFTCPDDAKEKWDFTQADTAALDGIPPCGILFIDSAHNQFQVHRELQHQHQVARYIILHDTISKASVGDKPDEPGINYALLPFLAKFSNVWRVEAHWNHSHGLTVLERCDHLY